MLIFQADKGSGEQLAKRDLRETEGRREERETLERQEHTGPQEIREQLEGLVPEVRWVSSLPAFHTVLRLPSKRITHFHKYYLLIFHLWHLYCNNRGATMVHFLMPVLYFKFGELDLLKHCFQNNYVSMTMRTQSYPTNI